jgi:hypothetical protein
MVNTTENSNSDVLDDIYGRLAALDFVVKRLLASHARRNPDGVAARMISNETELLRSLDDADIGQEQRAVMKRHIATMLRNARNLIV